METSSNVKYSVTITGWGGGGEKWSVSKITFGQVKICAEKPGSRATANQLEPHMNYYELFSRRHDLRQ